MTEPVAERDIIALVTGANKGIGLAAAGLLAARGITVLLGSRDPERGRAAAASLPPGGGPVHPVELDVTDPGTIHAAARHVSERFGRLDILVNNAGISGHPGAGASSAAGLDVVRRVYETNVFGVIAVTDAMLPLLRRSGSPRIVNVSSHVASMAHMTNSVHYLSRLPGNLAYPTSKTALNSLTVQYAKALRADGIMVNAVAPGACATDFARHLGLSLTRTAEDGAAIVVRLATMGRDSPAGGFFDDHGPVPW